MHNLTPASDAMVITSMAAELRWVHILHQLVTMQVQASFDKMHFVGRGKR